MTQERRSDGWQRDKQACSLTSYPWNEATRRHSLVQEAAGARAESAAPCVGQTRRRFGHNRGGERRPCSCSTSARLYGGSVGTETGRDSPHPYDMLGILLKKKKIHTLIGEAVLPPSDVSGLCTRGFSYPPFTARRPSHSLHGEQRGSGRLMETGCIFLCGSMCDVKGTTLIVHVQNGALT